MSVVFSFSRRNIFDCSIFCCPCKRIQVHRGHYWDLCKSSWARFLHSHPFRSIESFHQYHWSSRDNRRWVVLWIPVKKISVIAPIDWGSLVDKTGWVITREVLNIGHHQAGRKNHSQFWETIMAFSVAETSEKWKSELRFVCKTQSFASLFSRNQSHRASQCCGLICNWSFQWTSPIEYIFWANVSVCVVRKWFDQDLNHVFHHDPVCALIFHKMSVIFLMPLVQNFPMDKILKRMVADVANELSHYLRFSGYVGFSIPMNRSQPCVTILSEQLHDTVSDTFSSLDCDLLNWALSPCRLD